MNKSFSALDKNKAIQVICNVLGCFFVIPGVTYIFSEGSSQGPSGIIIILIFIVGPGVVFLWYGRHRKKLAKNFSEYMLLLSEDPNHSLYYISAKKNIPINEIKENLYEMMNKKLLCNAAIDETYNRVVFYGEQINITPNYNTEEVQMQYCDSCGAKLRQESKFCPQCGKTLGTYPEDPIMNPVFVEEAPRTNVKRKMKSTLFTCPNCGSIWIRSSSEEETQTVRVKKGLGSEMRLQTGGCIYWICIGWWWWLFIGWWFNPLVSLLSESWRHSNTKKRKVKVITKVYTCMKCGYVWEGRKTHRAL